LVSLFSVSAPVPPLDEEPPEVPVDDELVDVVDVVEVVGPVVEVVEVVELELDVVVAGVTVVVVVVESSPPQLASAIAATAPATSARRIWSDLTSDR
jgi:hypothetical protein